MNKLEKLYFNLLKTSARSARAAAGGKRIPSSERWGVKHRAEKAFTRRPWKTHGGDHDKEILDGMARLAWADYWAYREEEKGRSFSQRDIYEIAPKTPPGAKAWAKDVARRLLIQEKAPSLTHLFDLVVGAYGYPRDAEKFGNDLAFEALGHGINWRDRVKGTVPPNIIDVPHSEFYL